MTCKRKHPTNPDLFLCRVCNEYKGKREFTVCFRKVKDHIYGPYLYFSCRKCKAIADRLSPKRKESLMRWGKLAHEKRKRDRLYRNAMCRRYQLKATECLTNGHLRRAIREKSGHEPAQEEIDLVRQRIIMKRTLKQLKQWRKDYESKHEGMDGEQSDNEEIVQGNRGGG